MKQSRPIQSDHGIGRLELFGSVCLFLIFPVFVIFSSRSATVMLALSTLLIVASLHANGALTAFKTRVIEFARTPLVGLFLAASVFAALSILWSPDPLVSLETFCKVVGNFALIAAALAAFALAVSSERIKLLIAGLIFGAVLCIVQLHSDISMRGLIGARDDDFTVNRAMMTQSLLVWPAAAYLVARDHLVAAVAIIGFVTAAALTSESGAASLTMLVGIVVLIAAYISRGATLIVMSAVVAFAAVAMPWLVRIALDHLPAWFHEALASMASYTRAVLWNDFAVAIADKFWLGWGLNASRLLPIYAVSEPETRVVDLWWHPHNALLQVWIEFGLVGAVLAAIGLMYGVSLLARTERPLFPFAAAAFAGAFSASVVSHGAWENWWLSLMAITAIAFGALSKANSRN